MCVHHNNKFSPHTGTMGSEFINLSPFPKYEMHAVVCSVPSESISTDRSPMTCDMCVATCALSRDAPLETHKIYYKILQQTLQSVRDSVHYMRAHNEKANYRSLIMA